VLKPGALLLAFGGTRTYHRMVCAIEDAGFEIRDTIAWVYGSGFPKSYDISKGIDKQAGAEREVAPGRHLAVKGEMPIAGPAGRCVTCGKWRGSQPGNCQCEKHTAPSTPEAQLWDGWGTALKPAFEPIVVAMKPIDGTFVNNALTWGVSGLWIDGGRVDGKPRLTGTRNPNAQNGSGNCYTGSGGKKQMAYDANPPQGRFPANFIHDGSD
jgi:site-specific DNA-methyltransferase (adenine-specific)